MRRHFAFPLILALSSWAFAAPVPIVGDRPVPVDRLRIGNPAVLPMTGTWLFKLDHGVSPAIKGEIPPETAVPVFAIPSTPDSDWKGQFGRGQVSPFTLTTMEWLTEVVVWRASFGWSFLARCIM